MLHFPPCSSDYLNGFIDPFFIIPLSFWWVFWNQQRQTRVFLILCFPLPLFYLSSGFSVRLHLKDSLLVHDSISHSVFLVCLNGCLATSVWAHGIVMIELTFLCVSCLAHCLLEELFNICLFSEY